MAVHPGIPPGEIRHPFPAEGFPAYKRLPARSPADGFSSCRISAENNKIAPADPAFVRTYFPRRETIRRA